MARRKNTKRIDPRYFLNETTHRDLYEQQTGQLPTIKVDELIDGGGNAYQRIAGGTPRSLAPNAHPMFKVPNENLYFQMSPLLYQVDGKPKYFGLSIARGTTPRNVTKTIASADIRNQEDTFKVTNGAKWMGTVLKQAGYDVLEIVDDPEKEIKRMGYRS